MNSNNCCEKFRKCFCKNHRPKNKCDCNEIKKILEELFRKLRALAEKIEKCCKNEDDDDDDDDDDNQGEDNNNQR